MDNNGDLSTEASVVHIGFINLLANLDQTALLVVISKCRLGDSFYEQERDDGLPAMQQTCVET